MNPLGFTGTIVITGTAAEDGSVVLGEGEGNTVVTRVVGCTVVVTIITETKVGESVWVAGDFVTVVVAAVGVGLWGLG